MASPSNPQHEPTMEEILASIRKIISEDSNEPAQAAPAPAPAPPVSQPLAEADVLELTQEVEEAPLVQPAEPPAPVFAAAPEPIRQPDEVVFQTIEEPAPVAHTAHVAESSDLVSDRTRNAIDDALAGLDFDDEDDHAPARSVAPVSGLSVESVFDRAIRETFEPVLRQWLHEQADTIVERMKPVIREWMEEHLPDMLKSAVEAEVARAVRSRSKR